MVALGIGKNMARAARFWALASGMVEQSSGGGHRATQLGERIFGRFGLDPFLEDVRTLWLVHWNLSTIPEEPLFAWEYLLGRWPFAEVSRTEALGAFTAEARRLERTLSEVTLEQHLDVFIRTYVPSRGRGREAAEEEMDCPLVELALLDRVGERRLGEAGRREPVYAFSRERKPDITSGLFVYCLNDYWEKYRPGEQSVSFRDLSVAPGSPGRVLQLAEQDLRERLEAVQQDSKGVFRYVESAVRPQVVRRELNGIDLLAGVYRMDGDQ